MTGGIAANGKMVSKTDTKFTSLSCSWYTSRFDNVDVTALNSLTKDVYKSLRKKKKVHNYKIVRQADNIGSVM